MILLGIGLWTGKGRLAQQEHRSAGEILNYASPVELLFSPDGARLYVLCQQSDEVRVLDAATLCGGQEYCGRHGPRGFSLSPKGDRLFVANSWDDTVSVIDTQSLEVTATWPVGAEPSSVVEDRRRKAPVRGQSHFERCCGAGCADWCEEKRLAGGTRSELHYAICPMAAGCM